MALQCNICYDEFTNKIRHPITCDYEECKATICLQCFKRFLMMDGSEQECMACKQPISTEFIYMHTPKVFRDEYMKKIVDLDIARERALLKATQERINARVRRRILRYRITMLENHIRRCPKDIQMLIILEISKDEMNDLCRDIFDKSDEEINNNSSSFFCPETTCTGFVKDGDCDECKKTICAKCREERKDGHECNKDHIETIKLLKRDTKHCPRCKTPIYKIDGCDQMFCTNCKTAFSWRTLNIHKGIIHNPHYIQYMAQLNEGVVPIGPNDPCGEELDKALKEMVINIEYKNAAKETTDARAMVSNMFIPRVLNEINAILPVLANDVHDDETLRQIKQKLRETYLKQRKEMTIEKAEANWYNQLRLTYKRRELKKDLIKIIEVFERGLKDFLILGHANKDYNTMFVNIVNIVNYFKTQLTENEKRHNLKNRTTISIDHGLQCRLVAY